MSGTFLIILSPEKKKQFAKYAKKEGMGLGPWLKYLATKEIKRKEYRDEQHGVRPVAEDEGKGV